MLRKSLSGLGIMLNLILSKSCRIKIPVSKKNNFHYKSPLNVLEGNMLKPESGQWGYG